MREEEEGPTGEVGVCSASAKSVNELVSFFFGLKEAVSSAFRFHPEGERGLEKMCVGER